MKEVIKQYFLKNAGWLMLGPIFLFLVIFCIGMSLRTLFVPTALQEKYLSWESFIYLIFIYSTITLGFGLIYFLLMQDDTVIFHEHGTPYAGSTLEELQISFYFSGITMFSIGYGDVAPIGIGRMVAIIEGLIGYTIPASFVVRTVIDLRREHG
jgi:potassium channel LctB